MPSGQRHQTVNLTGFPFDGSNPSLATTTNAGVTQLVECQPSKLDVARSNRVARSIISKFFSSRGSVVEHSLGKGEVTGSIPVVSSIFLLKLFKTLNN